jgi:hypothetical protein
MCHTLPVLFSRSSSSISAVIFPSARSSGVHNTKLTAVAADEYTAKFTVSFTSRRTRVAPSAFAFPRIGASHTPGTATRAGFGFGFGFDFGFVVAGVVSVALTARITGRPPLVTDAPSPPFASIAHRLARSTRPRRALEIRPVPPLAPSRRASHDVVVVVAIAVARARIVDITVMVVHPPRAASADGRARARPPHRVFFSVASFSPRRPVGRYPQPVDAPGENRRS